MRRLHAQECVNLFVRVDRDTNARRRRLQEELGLSGPQLVGEAFRALERSLKSRSFSITGSITNKAR
jgi:hypothetical protein